MVSKQKQVLLTGATGFIGGYVLREIAKRKLAVTAFYRSKKPNDLADQNVRWLQSDMADGFPQASLSKIPDVLIHLAWGGLPNYNSDFHMTEELPRQKRFLEEAIQFGIRNVFVVGTCFEYGKIDGLLKEDFRTHPHTSYGEAKDELRQYVQKLQKDEAFNFTWGRLFYLYGAGQGERSLYTQLQNAIASKDQSFDMSLGAQERDFLPVERAAQYIVDLALIRQDLGPVNICSGKPKAVKNLVNEWLETANAQIQLNLGVYPYPDYEAMRFWGDNTRLTWALNTL